MDALLEKSERIQSICTVLLSCVLRTPCLTSVMGTQMPISHLQLPPPPGCFALKTQSELVVQWLAADTAAAEIAAAAQTILKKPAKSMHGAAAVTENITRTVLVGARAESVILSDHQSSPKHAFYTHL